jgi:hypothetical protein
LYSSSAMTNDAFRFSVVAQPLEPVKKTNPST